MHVVSPAAALPVDAAKMALVLTEPWQFLWAEVPTILAKRRNSLRAYYFVNCAGSSHHTVQLAGSHSMGNTKDGNDGNHKAKRPSLEGDDVSDEPIRGCLFKDANNADPTPRVEGDEPGGSRLLPLISRPENMCIRHKRMADEGATMRLQQVRTWRE